MKALAVLLVSLSVLLSLPAFAASTSSVTRAAGTQSAICPYENIVSAVVTSTAGANTSGLAAQGAGKIIYLEQVIIDSNSATANGKVLVTDGSGGTTKADLPFPLGTGATFVFKSPPAFTANTAVFVDPTGSDNIIVTLIGCVRAN